MQTEGAACTVHHLPDGEDEIWSTLLAPLRLRDINLSHRVVLAPVTRCRALNYVPQDAHVEYYSERATAGGLLITEGTAVSQDGIGFPHSPGIWTEQQVEKWRKVVQAVHDKDGYIFCQLWHVGRASHTYYQPANPGVGLCGPVSSTARSIPATCSLIRLPDGVMAEFSKPRALRLDEIHIVVEQFRRAARNAKRAGFDGVEIHAAHGYLIDQFLKDGINDREDDYGGSAENRCRFALDLVAAVAGEMGAERTAIRISPIIDHLEAYDSKPIELGLHLISHLNHMNLAYLHITEPRMTNQGLKAYSISSVCVDADKSLRLFRQAFKGKVMLSGGYTRETGKEAIRGGAADMISYGRLFISNPDLPLRFALGAELNASNRATFYTHHQVEGYLDYSKLTPTQVAQGLADKKKKLLQLVRLKPLSLRKVKCLGSNDRPFSPRPVVVSNGPLLD